MISIKAVFSVLMLFCFTMKKSKLKNLFLRKRRKNESFFKYSMGIIHLWLGLLSMLIVVNVCVTGCLYAFKNQFSEFVNREKIFVSENSKRKTVDEFQQMLSKNGSDLKSIMIPADGNRSFVISYTKNDVDFTAFFNPYSGENLGAPNVGNTKFFETVLDLHRNLMMGNVGRQINGAGVLMFCILLFSGFILWIPKKWKQLNQSLTVKFNGKFQRINYDLHNTLGFYSFLVLFFIAVTGLYITYPWVKNALIVSMGGDSISQISTSSEEDNSAFDNLFNDMLNRQKEKAQNVEKPVSLQKILDETQKILPYNAVTTLELPNKDNPRFMVTKINTDNFLGAMLPDQISFDKKGNLKSQELFWDKPLNKQFTSLAKPLHTGEILGLKSIIFYFIISLIGFSLPITGFIFWFNKLRKAL